MVFRRPRTLPICSRLIRTTPSPFASRAIRRVTCLAMPLVVDADLKWVQFQRAFVGTAGIPATNVAKAAAGAAKAAAAVAATPAAAASAPADSAETEPDRLALTNAVEGAVVTRFPPEASGFIHIGHAKAALINFMLAQKYKGKMVFRFDDTNPDKEKHHFEESILEDLGKLGVTWDVGPTFSSDHFPMLQAKAEELIRRGLAYCDTTPKEEMRKLRFDGVATAARSNTVEANTKLWKEMLAGTELGASACLRAKMSVDAANKALRDPVMYRVNLNPHARTGRKYNAYPTYDFTCPLVDSVEGVTHALRTSEYNDRNAQYYWFLEQLDMRKPIIEDFSRLNMEYAVMSKRKLTRLVEDGVVDGWDDPRFPTVRALLRRGVLVDALKDFVKVQGMSKVINFMEWNKLWSFNCSYLEPSVARYTCVSADTTTRCVIVGGKDVPTELVAKERPFHAKNPTLGNKTFFVSNVVLLDAEDVATVAEGEEVTLMGWCNCIVRKLVKNPESGLPVSAELELNPDGDARKTKKFTFVAENPANIRLVLNEYDHLLTKKKPEPEEDIEGLLQKTTHFVQGAIGEVAMKRLRKGDMIQLERRGFYIVDKVAADGVLSLIFIPGASEKLSHLSAKAQFLKAHPEAAAVQSPGKPPVTKAADGLTLEQKRALKKAKKEQGGKE